MWRFPIKPITCYAVVDIVSYTPFCIGGHAFLSCLWEELQFPWCCSIGQLNNCWWWQWLLQGDHTVLATLGGCTGFCDGKTGPGSSAVDCSQQSPTCRQLSSLTAEDTSTGRPHLLSANCLTACPELILKLQNFFAECTSLILQLISLHRNLFVE
jgi:hypothetical protein